MPTVAVIGGIGCGKTAVTEMLAARGAVVVDADVIAREVVEPGSPALGELVESFGKEILGPDGALDRAALAARAFADVDATARMNGILHPAIGRQLSEQVRRAREHARVVVVAIPLFRPEHRAGLGIDEVIVVDCAPEVAIARLVEHRGFTPEDAQRRIEAQASRDERLAAADTILENSGGLRDLERTVDELWDRLEAA